MTCQSSLSFSEQCETLDYLYRKIPNYSMRQLKLQIILGKSGSGKSNVTSISLLFALLNGLNCYITSLASRRASIFRYEHIHRLFGIVVNANDDVSAAAEKAMKKLERESQKADDLLSIDILLVQEIGLISVELLAIMDLVLQKLCNSSLRFGGVMVLANGDTFFSVHD